jgi:hypothetical protein
MGDVVDIAQKRLDRRDAARRAALVAELEAISTLGRPIDAAERVRMRETLGPDNLWAAPVESWDGS